MSLYNFHFQNFSPHDCKIKVNSPHILYPISHCPWVVYVLTSLFVIQLFLFRCVSRLSVCYCWRFGCSSVSKRMQSMLSLAVLTAIASVECNEVINNTCSPYNDNSTSLHSYHHKHCTGMGRGFSLSLVYTISRTSLT